VDGGHARLAGRSAGGALERGRGGVADSAKLALEVLAEQIVGRRGRSFHGSSRERSSVELRTPLPRAELALERSVASSSMRPQSVTPRGVPSSRKLWRSVTAGWPVMFVMACSAPCALGATI